MENLDILIDELVKYPDETPWLEFKHDNYDPDTAPRYMKYIPIWA